MSDKPRQRFRAERTGVGAPLGELETAVMRLVWASGKEGCFAADVQQSLEREKPVALTTILTTLDRLHDKGILSREREGKAYHYRAAVTQQELEQRIVEGVLNNLIVRFPNAVATYFSQAEPQNSNLTDLARRIAEIQAQRGSQEEPDV